MWVRLITILTFLFLLMPSFAQSADQHVLGTIMAIDTNNAEIKTTKGQMVILRVNKQTQYKDESNPKGVNRPAVGDRVVIKATKGEKKDSKLLFATEIYFSSIKRVPVLAQPVPAE